MDPLADAPRWHYTSLRAVRRIMETGEIRHMPVKAIRQLPFVWFSTDQLIESTATGLWTRDQLPEAAGKLARLAVSPQYPLWPWTELREPFLCSPSIMMMEASGKFLGADPELWWITAQPVPTYCITRAERWDGAAWIPYRPRRWLGDLTGTACAE